MGRLAHAMVFGMLLLTATAGAQDVSGQPEASSWEGEVFARVRPSVVRIETMHGIGAGFVYRDRSHVATAFHVIESGRSVSVIAVGGEEIGARVVAVDSDRDLAILSLERPISNASPLELQTADVMVGEPVLAIGHPFAMEASDDDENWQGLLNWSLSRGVIGAVGPGRLQSDAAVNPGSSGGPLLDREGKVLGVTVSGGSGLGFATRATHLESLVAQIDEHDAYDGRWRLTLDSSLILQWDDGDAWVGGELSIGALGYDRFALLGRVSVLALGADNQDPLFEQSGIRASFGAEAQYRIGLGVGPGVPFYIALGVGAQARFTNIEERRLSLGLADPACNPSVASCQFVTSSTSTSASNWSVLPTASINLILGVAQVGYEFQMDVDDPAASTHMLRLGFTF